MAIRSTLALIQQAQHKAPRIKAGIVLNMIKPRSGITQEVSGLLESLGTPLLQTKIHDRVSIARSSMTGGVLNGPDVRAKTEIMALTEEIVDQIMTG
jgi:chromosome partitioning protein